MFARRTRHQIYHYDLVENQSRNSTRLPTRKSSRTTSGSRCEVSYPQCIKSNVGSCLLWPPPPPKQLKQCPGVLNKDLAGGLDDLSIALVPQLLSLVLPALLLELPLLSLVLPALPFRLPQSD